MLKENLIFYFEFSLAVQEKKEVHRDREGGENVGRDKWSIHDGGK